MLLTNKNAVIYGAGGAIGGAVARAFAREGARVFLAGDTQPPIDALAMEIANTGGVAEAALVDALDARGVEQHAKSIIEKAGSIDVSFNLIAIPHVHGKPYIDLSLEEFAQPIGAFDTTHFLTATAAARHMVPAKAGVILMMMTTPAGRTASTFSGAFGPVCALIESFAKGLAAEVGPHGVRVVCLRSSGSPEAPGVLEAMKSHAKAEGKPLERFLADLTKGTLLGRLTKLTEVADVAAFLASDRASAMTGTSANVSCGIGVD